MQPEAPETTQPNDTPRAVEIVRNDERSRYEARLGDEVVGFAEYVQRDGVIEFPETFVQPAHEGHGIASQLARVALDEVRARGTERVVPTCWYIAKWIERHPDYAGLLRPAGSDDSGNESDADTASDATGSPAEA